MPKSNVSVNGPVQGERCRLDYLSRGDAFICDDDNKLHLVLTSPGNRADGIDCLRLSEARVLRRFCRDYMVMPVDYTIEWSIRNG